jgi:hypothetical protein
MLVSIIQDNKILWASEMDFEDAMNKFKDLVMHFVGQGEFTSDDMDDAIENGQATFPVASPETGIVSDLTVNLDESMGDFPFEI